ncbi:sulfatase family protein [Microbacterium terrisoli]|uniref:sulfatase family protein n=1 Tax=Microbacterium terrisoli TaxID=3242192 RepID=UPI002803EC9B|nr:arylsulfatase [Microbacterium protaetiae]
MTAVTRRRSVVVFLADDLGWGDLGCFGSTAIRTPVLDALAEGGMRFTDCHAVSAVCTPSRYGLLTGEYPWRSPLREGVLGGTDPSILRDGQITVASMFRDAGYRTGAFGKWHLGLGWTRLDGTTRAAFDGAFHPDMQASGRDVDYSAPFADGPISHGFDRFFGIAGSLDMPPYCYLDQDRTVGIPDREKDPLVTSQRPGLQVEGWQDDRVDVDIIDTACDWIREQAALDQPFFAYVASAAPHRPCVPPEFVQGLSEAGARGDAVCLVDWMVGRIQDVLREAGIAQDTLIVFTSDNGAPMIFPEDGDVTEHHPNGAWRGQKADAWEGGHRVPLIVAGPGIVSGTVDEPVSLLDVLPTLAMLTGISASNSAGDGVVLAGFTPSRARIIGQQAFDGALTLRAGDEKVILSTGSGGFSDPVGHPVAVTAEVAQFYDLGDDPGERENLWHERRARVAEMLARFSAQTGYRHEVVDDG